MDDQQFRQLLDFLGLSWEGYRKVKRGVKKALVRYIREQEFRSMDEFLSVLEENLEERETRSQY